MTLDFSYQQFTPKKKKKLPSHSHPKPLARLSLSILHILYLVHFLLRISKTRIPVFVGFLVGKGDLFSNFNFGFMLSLDCAFFRLWDERRLLDRVSRGVRLVETLKFSVDIFLGGLYILGEILSG